MEDDNILDYIDLPLNQTSQIKPPIMFVHALDLEKQDSAYELYPDNLGPLQPSIPNTEIREFLRSITYFEVVFGFEQKLPHNKELTASCFSWDLR